MPSTVIIAAGEINNNRLKPPLARQDNRIWFTKCDYGEEIALFRFRYKKQAVVKPGWMNWVEIGHSSPLLSCLSVCKQRMAAVEGRGQSCSHLPVLSWLHFSSFPQFICSLLSFSLSAANCTLCLSAFYTAFASTHINQSGSHAVQITKRCQCEPGSMLNSLSSQCYLQAGQTHDLVAHL